jgi:hypothetical protein
MTALPNVSAACIGDHHISIRPTSNFVPFYSPWMSLLLPWPTKWQVSCCSFSVTPLHQILSWWVHPCLFVGWNTSLRGGNRFSRIKLPHDLLAPCNSCFLVVLENQVPVHSWLADELPKLQSCLELCRFTQALLQPGIARWETPFLLELARESDYDTRLNRCLISQGTEPKGRMSCLECRCYN